MLENCLVIMGSLTYFDEFHHGQNRKTANLNLCVQMARFCYILMWQANGQRTDSQFLQTP